MVTRTKEINIESGQMIYMIVLKRREGERDREAENWTYRGFVSTFGGNG